MGGGYGRRTIVPRDTLAPPQATACLIFSGQVQHHDVWNKKGCKCRARSRGGGGGVMGVITPLFDFEL